MGWPLLLGKLEILGFFPAQTNSMVQAFGVNHYLTDERGNPPSGTLVLTGNGQKQSFDHKIIRKVANKPGAKAVSVANVIAVSDKKLFTAIPADEKK